MCDSFRFFGTTGCRNSSEASVGRLKGESAVPRSANLAVSRTVLLMSSGAEVFANYACSCSTQTSVAVAHDGVGICAE